jgi:radical SAM protein with 4Fe4S-binding SPASM domain
MKTVTRVLAEAAALRAKQITFGGGEPTMSPSFQEAVQEATGSGFTTEVFTCGANGYTDGHLVPLPTRLLRNLAHPQGQLTFVFSFHGACSAVHDAMTGVDGSFDCMTESLRRCKRSGVRCTANFVPTRLNASVLPGLVSLLEDLTIPKLSVLRFVPQGRGMSNRKQLELNREEEDAFVDKLMHLRNIANIEIRTGSPFNGIVPDNNVPCRAGHQKLVIQANGNVLPCEVFKHHGRCHWGASVHDASLSEIMGSPGYVALHKTLLEGHCVTCPVHRILRANQPHLGAMHGISKTTV